MNFKRKFTIGLIAAIAAGSLLYWTDWRFHAQEFLIAYLIFVIVLLVGATFEKREQLKTAGIVGTAKMKWRAEIWAGCTVIAFAGQFLQLGSIFDSDRVNNRLDRLNAAAKQIELASKCIRPASSAQCRVLQYELDLLPSYASRKPDSEFTVVIAQIKSMLPQPANSPLPKETLDALKDLDELNSSNDWLFGLIRPFPVLALMFASLAISSKIALAWRELLDREKVEAEKKEKEAKAKAEAAAAAAALAAATAAATGAAATATAAATASAAAATTAAAAATAAAATVATVVTAAKLASTSVPGNMLQPRSLRGNRRPTVR